MKLPSLSYLADQATVVLKRFPLTILSGVIASFIAIYLIEVEKGLAITLPYINALLTFALGIPLFFCVKVLAEKHDYSKTVSWLITGLGSVLLLLIYLSFPDDIETPQLRVPYIKYGIYNVAMHLIVAFLPYWNDKENIGFWHYNKSLFLRLCLALLYSLFIYVGILLALLSIEGLFDIDIDSKRYFQLPVFIIGIFNTWFFLAGVPSEYQSLESDNEYPSGLKIFGQYILIPLLSLYLIILYSYTSKIIILWDWPSGLVSYLISGVATLGIFTLLILYPYSKLHTHRWLFIYSKTYYFLLAPLIFVLFLAIAFRIGDYGITVNRYAITALGVWLACISLYFMAGGKNIKIVPLSLSVFLIIISFGPWGIFRVSQQSQSDRLKKIFSEADILKENKILSEADLFWDEGLKSIAVSEYSNENKLSDSLYNEVYSIVNYLDDYHGLKEEFTWFQQSFDTLITKSDSYNKMPRIFMNAAGLKYSYRRVDHEKWIEFHAPENQIYTIEGFDYMIDISFYGNRSVKNFTYDESANEIQVINGEDMSHLILKTHEGDSINIDLNAYVDDLVKNEYVNLDRRMQLEGDHLHVAFKDEKMQGKMIFKRVSLKEKDDIWLITGYEALLVFKYPD